MSSQSTATPSTHHPTDIEARGWVATLKRVYGEIGEDRVGLIAAGCAFYGLLAIFPGIFAALALAGLVTEPAVLVEQLEDLATVMPDAAAEIVVGQATEVAGSGEGGLGLAAIAGIGIALYSASKGIDSLMQGLNIAFDIQDSRGLVAHTATKLALTFGAILGFVATLAVLAGLPVLLNVLPLGGATEILISLASWALIFVLVSVGLAILYRYGPDRDVGWRWITPGAALATIVWALGSAAFAVYVSNFGSYNETFGALGGVVVLLTWLWLSAFIVLMGAEFDSEMERQAKRDPGGDGRLSPEKSG